MTRPSSATSSATCWPTRWSTSRPRRDRQTLRSSSPSRRLRCRRPEGCAVRRGLPLPETRDEPPRSLHVGAVGIAELGRQDALLVQQADREADQRWNQAGGDREPVAERESDAERREQQARVAGMADQPVGAVLDDAMVLVDDDRVAEEAAERPDRPDAKHDPEGEDTEAGERRPPPRAGKRQGLHRGRHENAEPDAADEGGGQHRFARVARLGVAHRGLQGERTLAQQPGREQDPEDDLRRAAVEHEWGHVSRGPDLTVRPEGPRRRADTNVRLDDPLNPNVILPAPSIHWYSPAARKVAERIERS